MRLDEFLVRDSDRERKLRFHDRLTVVSGLAAPDRAVLAAALGRACVGEEPGCSVAGIDVLGRRFVIEPGPDGPRATVDPTTWDGGPLPPPLLHPPVTITAGDLGLADLDFSLSESELDVLDGDLGLGPGLPDLAGTPAAEAGQALLEHELAEARERLAALQADLAHAERGAERLKTLRAELAAIDARLTRHRHVRTRQRYVELRARVDALRTELAAADVATDTDAEPGPGAAADEQIAQAGRAVLDAAAAWSEATRRARRTRAALELFDRSTTPPPTRAIDRGAVARLVSSPGRLDELEEAVTAAERARAELAALEARLEALGGAELPEEGDPLVRRLARLEQQPLWDALDALDALDTVEAFWGPRRRGGGAVVVGVAASALAAAAAGWLAGWFAGAVAGLVALTALAIAVAVRRRRSRGGESADASYVARALAVWRERSGDADPDAARAQRARIRSYADARRALGADAERAEDARLGLEPARERLAAAEQRVQELLSGRTRSRRDPLVVEDPAATVRAARRARLAADLVEALHAEEEAAAELAARCDEVGVSTERDLAGRATAALEVVAAAAQRHAARQAGRPRHVIQAELDEATAALAPLLDPEALLPPDEADPDVHQLVLDRAAREERVAALVPLAAEVKPLAARHDRAARRVQALEAALEEARSGCRDVQAITARLVALVGRAHAVAVDDTLPVLLDEPFAAVHGETRAQLLALLTRLAQHTQLVYLTGDAQVADWARELMTREEAVLLGDLPAA